jgi:predicted nuclease of restriction endonuclease-like (RecB) superfamily
VFFYNIFARKIKRRINRHKTSGCWTYSNPQIFELLKLLNPMDKIDLPTDYIQWLDSIKNLIRTAQTQAVLTVNKAMIVHYWDLGKRIAEKQENEGWGNAVVERLSADLRREFPDATGYSRSNLFYMRQFFRFYQDAPEFIQQAVGQIPWGHNIQIFNKSGSWEEAYFYLDATVRYNWARSVLTIQMETKLYDRQGKSVTNFAQTLPAIQAELAQQTLKDPYIFGFMTLEKEVHELELERRLTQQITKFLLELGAGFAFLGRQYPFELDDKSYALDLLFYHVRLRCFVVIDLKMEPFKPEHAGKMNFYLSAVDDLMRAPGDQPSIGLILCKSKSRIEAEYALRNINSPIGVSDFQVTVSLPENLTENLPSVEDIERELEQGLQTED